MSNLTPEERSELLTDVLMLFQRRERGGMARWAYLNGGRAPLERFFKNPLYDGQREIQIIPEIGERAADILPNRFNLIELGPGDAYETKTKQFIEAFNKAAGVKTASERIATYTALDIVEDYARDSKTSIKAAFGITSTGLVEDYEDFQGPLTNNGLPNVMIAWNPPIWNAPRRQNANPGFTYADHLRKLINMVDQNGFLILTHYPGNKPAELKDIYMVDDCRDAVMAILALIDKELKPEIIDENGVTLKDVRLQDCFGYDVDIGGDFGIVDMNIVANRNFGIKIGDFTAKFTVGDKFAAVGSAKPSQPQVLDMAHRVNVNSHASIANKMGAAQILGPRPSQN